MQKVLITVAILFCFFTIKTQTPTITIKCTFGSDCFTPNPAEIITYSFDVTPGWTASNISWQAPGSSDRSTNGGSTYWVIWPNNTAAKSIQVSAILTNGSNSTSKSDTKTVTVKQISTITSMTVTGTGVSGTFSNNGTVNVPCGSRTLNISVPTPSTNPTSGVNYTWLLPSGWTGSSTTNSISANANAGANDGIIRLQYRRNDGNFTQEFSLNVDRPQVGVPDISGNLGDVFCSGETRSVTATAANATSFQWSGTSGISATPNNAATTSISATANGTLTLTVNNACQAPQTRNQSITFGTPTLYGASPSGSFNYINGNTLLSIQSNSGCVAYKWEIVNGSGYISPNPNYSCPRTFGGVTYGDNNVCYVSTSDFVRVRVTSANKCGVGASWTFYLQNGSGFMMTSPNPATNTVSLEFASEFIAENVKSVELIRDGDLRTARSFQPAGDRTNPEYAAFLSNRTLAFDVTNLPRGRYYLSVVYKEGDKKFTEILLLQYLLL